MMSSFEVEFQDCTHVCIQWSLDNKVNDLSQSPSKESEQLDWTVKPLIIGDVYANNKDRSWYSIGVLRERLKNQREYSHKDGLLCKTTVSKPSAWILQSAEF